MLTNNIDTECMFFVVQYIDIYVRDDEEPELREDFIVSLFEAMSSDGLVGTTPTSGASIDLDARLNNITVAESDYPYGLMEFSVMKTLPMPGDPRVPPATEQPKVTRHQNVYNVFESNTKVNIIM